MPALRTLIDGVAIATVSTDGYNLLSVRVSGTRITEELATIEISGGIYPEGENFTHLIWATDIHLLSHQEVVVQYLEKAETSHSGKTIDEQYPDESHDEEYDFTITPQMFTNLRAMPIYRTGFKFLFESSQSTNLLVDTTPEDHGFSFSVFWDSFQPQNARISLHTYTIQSMEDKIDSSYHVQEKMNFGDEVKFTLFA